MNIYRIEYEYDNGACIKKKIGYYISSLLNMDYDEIEKHFIKKFSYTGSDDIIKILDIVPINFCGEYIIY